ncbi:MULTISPECIES: hydrolase [Pseudomonas]|jgi:nicotinamidase-related amidase|uniref:Hydrolase n=1 Tax=Pseudomonas mosselii TaxID=78327 RepID=A0A5R8YKB2_9PSED|nr:hydrolase [Pseudomonas mosselii]TLP53456.1 hydrolase [Pseudomonas mosselii]
MLIDSSKATLLVVDIQEKLIHAMSDPLGTAARARWLLAACADLELPTVISEQYPKGLGHTLEALTAAAPGALIVEKLHFSCVSAQCLPAELMAREQVIVCGMETHVCVLQSVLGLLALGKQVFVVEDACDSRTAASKAAGLARMRSAGAQVVTREMVLFELLGSASHPLFRHISKTYLVGEQPQ